MRMGWVALGSELLFVGAALLLRVWLQRRWTGRSGIAIPWRGAGSAERAAVLQLGVAVLALAGVTLLSVARFDIPGRIPAGVAVHAAGACLVAVGVAMTVWSQLHMRESWRIGVDRGSNTDLVTDGPFRLVRNPIYSASILFVIGIAMLLPYVPTLVGVAALIAGLEIQVRWVEEPHLIASHGATYIDWARRTGRFLPGVGKLSWPRRR
jgi:protein-S-isoprenylcysteine O-methyltransferase Ste14